MFKLLVVVVSLLAVFGLPLYIALPMLLILICAGCFIWGPADSDDVPGAKETRQALERTRTVLGELDDHRRAADGAT